MLLLWVYIPLALGWSLHTRFKVLPDHTDSFHRMLFLSDNIPLESRTKFEIKGVSEILKGNKEHVNKHEDTGISHEHHLDTGKKGHSDKEKHSHTWGEESGKADKTSSKGEVAGGHHSENEKDYSHKFKDRLLHKSGNYEKGYHDKYHLDEVVKLDTFWNKHHSHELFDKYGQHGSTYHQAHDDHSAGRHKQSTNKHAEGGQKGESAGSHSSSDKKGHQSQGGSQSKYENKEEYSKKDGKEKSR